MIVCQQIGQFRRQDERLCLNFFITSQKHSGYFYIFWNYICIKIKHFNDVRKITQSLTKTFSRVNWISETILGYLSSRFKDNLFFFPESYSTFQYYFYLYFFFKKKWLINHDSIFLKPKNLELGNFCNLKPGIYNYLHALCKTPQPAFPGGIPNLYFPNRIEISLLKSNYYLFMSVR